MANIESSSRRLSVYCSFTSERYVLAGTGMFPPSVVGGGLEHQARRRAWVNTADYGTFV